MVQGFKNVLVFGCNTCVAICHAGGGKEAEILATMIRMKAAEEGIALQASHLAVQRHCEPEYFEPVIEQVRGYDLILSTAAAWGELSHRAHRPVRSTPESTPPFMERFLRPVISSSSARAAATASSTSPADLPIARCSKSLMNGPCGGTDKGKCE